MINRRPIELYAAILMPSMALAVLWFNIPVISVMRSLSDAIATFGDDWSPLPFLAHVRGLVTGVDLVEFVRGLFDEPMRIVRGAVAMGVVRVVYMVAKIMVFGRI